MNHEQKTAYDFVHNHYIEYLNSEYPEEIPSFQLFISGPGGAGKSYLISAIQELIHRLTLLPRSCIVTAPTGVAAFNISGTTIHRALNLPIQHNNSTPYVPLSGEKLHDLRITWQNVSTPIIDEISMVSYETLEHIHLRLNEIKGSSNSSVYYGGFNIIAVGDFYQLPPVLNPPVYSPHLKRKAGSHLWFDHFRFIELKQVERQKGDQQFIDALSRIRLGSPIDEDLDCLLSRVVQTIPSDIDILNRELFIFPTVVQCNAHNDDMLKTVSERSPVYKFVAKHALMESYSKGVYHKYSNNVDPSLIPKDNRDCAGLPESFSFAIGAVVMLRRNIDTSQGLVNGA